MIYNIYVISPDISLRPSAKFHPGRAFFNPIAPFDRVHQLFVDDERTHTVAFGEDLISIARDATIAFILAALPGTQLLAGIMFFKASADVFKGGYDLAQSALASSRRDRPN